MAAFDFSSWLRQASPRSRRADKRIARRKKPQVLALEQLEDRLTPSTANAIDFVAPVPATTAGQKSGPITIQVFDTNNNPLVGEKVDLSTSNSATGVFYNSAGTAQITSVTTGANGEISFLYGDSTPGTPTLTATDDATPAVKMTQAETVYAPASAITFTSAPKTTPAGQKSSPITITVSNINGALPNEKVDLTTSDPLTGEFFNLAGNQITSVTTDAAGDAVSFVYEDSAAGSATVTAIDDFNHSVFATQQETISAGVGTINFTTSPMTVPVNTASGAITIQAKDANGNAISGELVDLSSSSATGTFSATVGGTYTHTLQVTTVGGRNVNFFYKDATPGSATLTATDDANPSVSNTQTETIIGAATSITFVQPNATIATAGQISGTITLLVKDVNGNPVANEQVTLTSTNTGTGRFYNSTGTLLGASPQTVTTGANGMVAFRYSDTVAGSPTLTATDNGTPSVFATQTETINPAAASKIVFLPSSANNVTVNKQSAPITIQIEDANGNAVSGAVLVDLSSNAPTGKFYDSTGANVITMVTTGANGQATFLYEDSAPGTTLTATEDANINVTGTHNINVTGVAASITFSPNPTTLTAGQKTGPITLTVKDGGGNPVAGELVDLKSDSTTGTFYSATTGAPITSVTTGDNGTVTFLYGDTTVGTAHLTATDDANHAVVSSPVETVTVVAAATTISFTSVPVTVIAGAQSSTITIHVGNPGNLANEKVDLTSSSGTGVFYSTANGAQITSVTTDSNGNATFKYQDTTAGMPVVTITDDANPALKATQTETINAGAGAVITFTTPPFFVTKGNVSGPITILVKDANGNVVPNEVVAISVTSAGKFSTSSSGPFTAPLNVTTGSNGQATFFFTDGGTGTPTITATDVAHNAVVATQKETVTNVAASITFTTSPTSTPAGQKSAPITIKVWDAAAGTGNPVVGEVVDLSSSNSVTGTFYDSTGTNVITSVTTGANGTVSFVYQDSAAGPATLTATDHLNNAVKMTQTETITASSSSIVFTTAPVTVAAGATSTGITIETKDANGNPVTGEMVTLKSSSATGLFSTSSNGAGGTATLTVTSGAGGTVTFYYTDTKAGSPVVTATDVLHNTEFATQTETVTAGAASVITFTTNPVSVTVGQEGGPITILVKDANGNLVTNEAVNLKSSSLTGTFSATSGGAQTTTLQVITTANGTATFFYEDSTAGTPTVTATDGTTPSVFATQTETINAIPVVPTYAVADFTGHGVYRFIDTTGAANAATTEWTQLTNADATTVAIDATGDVVAVFSAAYGSAGQGVWRYETSTGWVRLGSAIATSVGIAGPGDVVANYSTSIYGSGGGVYRYEDGPGFQHLSVKDSSSPAGLVVPAAINGLNAGLVGIDAAGNVVADFTGHGIWSYISSSTSWVNMSPADASSLQVTSNGTLAADFPNAGAATGLWENVSDTTTAGWNQMTTINVPAFSVNASNQFAAVFSAPPNGMGVYTFAGSFNGQITTANLHPLTGAEPAVNPSAVGIAASDNIFANFGSQGLWYFNSNTDVWAQADPTGVPASTLVPTFFAN